MNFVKTQYTDSRLGMAVLSPVLSISNFILIAYNFTIFKIISFEIFIPFFAVFLILLTVIIGKIFRKHQQATDNALGYEQNKEMVKTHLLVIEALENLSNDTMKFRLKPRIEYLRSLLK